MRSLQVFVLALAVVGLRADYQQVGGIVAPEHASGVVQLPATIEAGISHLPAASGVESDLVHLPGIVEAESIPEFGHLPGNIDIIVPDFGHLPGAVESEVVPEFGHLPGAVESEVVPEFGHLPGAVESEVVPDFGHLPGAVESEVVPDFGHLPGAVDSEVVPDFGHLPGAVESEVVPDFGHLPGSVESEVVPDFGHLPGAVESGAVPEFGHLPGTIETDATPEMQQPVPPCIGYVRSLLQAVLAQLPVAQEPKEELTPVEVEHIPGVADEESIPVKEVDDVNAPGVVTDLYANPCVACFDHLQVLVEKIHSYNSITTF